MTVISNPLFNRILAVLGKPKYLPSNTPDDGNFDWRKPCQTMDGRKVRVIDNDGKGNFSLRVEITDHDGKTLRRSYWECGYIPGDGCEPCDVLVNC